MSRRLASGENVLERRVMERLRRECSVAPGERLLIGVSGGADSVALLHLLAAVAPRLHLHLEVAHFDHALRVDSAVDARFVLDLALAFGLPAHVQRWAEPVRGENAARRARFAFFEATARRADCTALVLAHHLDDQIETLLLRLGRGTGLRGSRGIAWRRRGPLPVVRPLLDTRRRDLRRDLEARGGTWRDDVTNRDLTPARNRVRHLALPALEAALGDGWMERWAASLPDWRQAHELVEASALELLERALDADATRCRASVLRQAPRLLARLALQHWFEKQTACDIDRAHILSCEGLLHRGTSGRRIALPRGWRLGLESDQLVMWRAPAIVEPDGATHQLDVEGCDGATARAALAARLVPEPTFLPPPVDEAWIEARTVDPPLALRLPRAGDRVQLLGAPGSRTLRRILQDRKVPARLRASWPLVEDEHGIVWVPGVGIAARAGIGPRTERALHLRFRQPDRGAAGVAQPKPDP